ncbi:efflux RND transporter permease subunit [Pseudarthrobacter sp. J75]|uniref:MMPL family transporter n=1 Tax=unclassified Pseudarthrobacter TaxID=2647000 RepID=UPI002E811A2D|nr:MULTISPECIES: efflux RND transporter permease subunit [unclassified Pseudarthrobacter]MEE2524085.1 efflux RND transporter permease subunit [Pseudarthrobacter sp. J47]MEE2530364.1 efflux RND transporter permease subunit [Pseudarthrobacter sp. J75]
MNPTLRHSDRTPVWLRWVIPAVLVLTWLAIAGVGGPTFGRLDEVSSNDQASFLPASAEATVAQDWQAKFRDSDEIPAVIVIEGADALTPAQLGQAAALKQQIEGLALGSTVIGPIPSEDGKAVQFIAPIAESDQLRESVQELRDLTADAAPEGMQAFVTGPAGLTADLVSAFAGIDGILLLVALGAVFVILLIVYRSLLLPLAVLLTSVFALCAAILLVFGMAKLGWIQLSGQSQGILSILVIGAATDYALLYVARFREALTHTTNRTAAVLTAWKASFEPILASGATVIIALLCLLFSDLNSNKALGPVAAAGIVCSLFGALTLLPALMALLGRAAFWPFIPKLVPAGEREPELVTGLEGQKGLWRATGALVSRRPRTVWTASVLLLVAASAGVLQLKANGVPQTDVILTASNAVDGQDALVRHFDAGSGSPAVVVVDEGKAAQALEAVETSDGVGQAYLLAPGSVPITGAPGTPSAPDVREGKVLINATLDYAADSAEAEGVITSLRSDLKAVDPDALVGGVTATALDTNTTAQRDLAVIIPIVLVVILLILMLLLRSVLAPVLLVLSVVLSYGAAMGVSALVFNHVFGFPGADATVPLFGFVFLVALGVDYNIFLMSRVREESLKHGTRPGILRGLGVTGGVITSAGVVLAATFAALGVIPIMFLVQLAFIVAFGVLLDTVLVRSLLVPALAYDIGPKIWWPGKLARPEAAATSPRTPATSPR